ncbi:MAG: hypothetical protein ABIW81_06395 [Terrimesophilobacter sp.]
MTRFGIDAQVAIRIATEQLRVPNTDQLVAPNRLRSDALKILYCAVRKGTMRQDEAHRILDGVTTTRIRLLGDRVSRTEAWKIAEHLGWDDTAQAEYVAVAKLQAEVFVTLDLGLARKVDGIVPVASFDAVFAQHHS